MILPKQKPMTHTKFVVQVNQTFAYVSIYERFSVGKTVHHDIGFLASLEKTFLHKANL